MIKQQDNDLLWISWSNIPVLSQALYQAGIAFKSR